MSTDGTVEIFESGAIVLHIAQQKPGLLPGDPAGAASAIAWIFSALNSVEPLIFDRLWVDVFDRNEPYADLFRPKATERLLEMVMPALATIRKIMRVYPYKMTGSRISMGIRLRMPTRILARNSRRSTGLSTRIELISSSPRG